MPPTTVLHLVNEFAHSSVNGLILEIIQGLDRNEYQMHVGCLKQAGGPMESVFRDAGARTIGFQMDGMVSPGSVGRVASYVRSHGIQVVHTHVLRPDLVGGIVARLARRPALVSTKHNTEYVRGQKGWLIRNLCYWPAMYFPDRVVTVTEVLRKQVLSRLKMSPNRVVTIHNGIAADSYYRPDARLDCRNALGLKPDEPVVTFAGRLERVKGLGYLLLSARETLVEKPDVRFVLAGDGSLRSELQLLAHRLGIASHVLFTGFRNDMPELLAASDLVVLPSIGSEGLPLCVLEAMAAGKAVVATHVSGTVELVKPGVTGLLVPPRDPAALARAIISLLGNPRNREEMGERARARARKDFDIHRMVDEYDAMYRGLLAEKAA